MSDKVHLLPHHVGSETQFKLRYEAVGDFFSLLNLSSASGHPLTNITVQPTTTSTAKEVVFDAALSLNGIRFLCAAVENGHVIGGNRGRRAGLHGRAEAGGMKRPLNIIVDDLAAWMREGRPGEQVIATVWTRDDFPAPWDRLMEVWTRADSERLIEATRPIIEQVIKDKIIQGG